MLQDLYKKTQFLPTSALKTRNSIEMTAIFYNEHKTLKFKNIADANNSSQLTEKEKPTLV